MADQTLHWFADMQIGSKRRKTREGYLICEDVPIARLGPMLYARGEIPIPAGMDGTIVVTRDEKELFNTDTIDSFNGRPVVVHHPSEMLDIDNWKDHAVGHAMNVRRGTGVNADFMMADLMITHDEGIRAIEGGMTQISNGYQAEYKSTGLGRGYQHHIVGNHIAIVPNGRCGSTCSIGDSADRVIEIQKGPNMKTMTPEVLARLTTAWTTKDQATIDEIMGQMSQPPGKPADSLPSPADDPVSNAGSHRIIVNVHGGAPGGAPGAVGAGAPPAAPGMPADPAAAAAAPIVQPGGAPVSPAALPAGGSDPQMLGLLQQILAALTGGDDDGAPDEDDGDGVVPTEADDEADSGDVPPTPPKPTKDAVPVKKKVVTHDSSALADAFTDVLVRAEILCPGVQGMTFDAKADPVATQDSMCALMRRALKGGYATDETRALIEPLLADKTDTSFTKMTCDSLKVVFTAASQMKRAANNTNTIQTPTRDVGSKKAPTISELQARNDEFWKSRTA